MLDVRLTVSETQFRRAVWAMLGFEVALAALNFVPIPWATVERQILLENEGNFPTWLASTQFFVLAMAAWLLARRDSEQRARRTMWRATGAVLLLLSMDDACSFHEFAGRDLALKLGLPTWPSPTWMLVFAPCILFGLGLLYWLLFRGLRGDHRAFRLGLAGVLLWAGALILEVTRGWMISVGCDPLWGNARPQPVFEELFELMGGTLLLAGMLEKLKAESGKGK
ncbi:MAG: hypothetical protein PHI18_03845 [bacterium]|nr:hypothetical protein [bacterium]